MADWRGFTKEELARMFAFRGEEGVLSRVFIRGDKPANMVWDVGEYYEIAKIGYRGHLIPATHICFLLETGRWPRPGYIITHLDGNVWNCKWNNLSEVVQQERYGNFRMMKILANELQ